MVLHQNQFSIEFELRWKNRSWDGPRATKSEEANANEKKYVLAIACTSPLAN